MVDSEIPVDVHPEVADALADARPVVALESTIFSSLGLPGPHNDECRHRCEAAIRSVGAVPAMTAVLDGRLRVGLAGDDLERVLGGTTKLSARDLGVAVGMRWPVGVTTVAASVRIAALVGIDVFATGGIGGVHRQSELTGDVSADLGALAAWPVTTVTAGAKAFLDLGKTVELLDTLGVPLIGFGTDEFPAFYSRSSGVPVPQRIDRVDDLVSVIDGCRSVGYSGGIVVANPIPADAEIPAGHISEHIVNALEAADRDGIVGAAVTPFVLGVLAEATEGRSIPANLALAESNAALAAEIAVGLVALR